MNILRFAKFALSALALSTASEAATAQSNIENYQIKVAYQVGDKITRYETSARVYSLGPKYKAELYAFGSYSMRDSAIASSIKDLIASKPRSIVTNGGFSGADPTVPAGLLILDGRIAHPMSAVSAQDPRTDLSAIVCLSAIGKLKLVHSKEFISATPSARARCNSAFQAKPFVVDNAQNVINFSELSNRSPYTRTILGLDLQGRPWIVVFRRPVHLYAAAEFLRARRSDRRSISIIGSSSGMTATSGLELTTAVNLAGDLNSVIGINGKVDVGDSTRALPDAIVFSDINAK